MDVLGLNIWYWFGALVILFALWGVARYAPKKPTAKKAKSKKKK